MRSDLSDLLERGAERPSAEPDFGDIARRGRRRRHVEQATSAMAVVAVLALTASVLVPRLRQPDVVFDSGPKAGIGTWELVPDAPIGPRVNALEATDGRRVVVFGGDAPPDEDGNEVGRDGAVYDTKTGAWTVIPPAPFAGTARLEGDIVSPLSDMQLLDDGRLMLVRNNPVEAAFYDFSAGVWETTGPADLSRREAASITWTGEQLVVWGGAVFGTFGSRERTDGAVWEPEGGWHEMAPSPLAGRTEFASAWTGEELLIWGGGAGTAGAGQDERVFADGAAYDPQTDTWRPLPDGPLAARQGTDGVWTGEELVVMGGYGAATPLKRPQRRSDEPTTKEDCDDAKCEVTSSAELTIEPQSADGEDFTDGARYNPSTDVWTPVARPPTEARELIVEAIDGRYVSFGRRHVALHEPATDTWKMSTTPPLGQHGFDLIVAGDHLLTLNTRTDIDMRDLDRPRRLGGLTWDAAQRRWDAVTEADTAQRGGAVVIAAGDRVFVWGGQSVTRDTTGGFTSENDPRFAHADGGILTLP